MISEDRLVLYKLELTFDCAVTCKDHMVHIRIAMIECPVICKGQPGANWWL